MECYHCGHVIEQSWVYCAFCGSRAGSIDVSDRSYSGSGPHPLTLKQDGHPVPFQIEAHPNVRCAPDRGTMVGLTTVYLTFASELVQTNHLVICTGDGPRADIWSTECKRVRTISVTLEEAVDRLSIFPRTLIFRPGVQSRKVEVENTGTVPRKLTECVATHGLSVSAPLDQVIAPGQKLVLEIASRSNVTQGSVALRFEADGGSRFPAANFEVPVVGIPGGIRRVPEAYVGIDFGTSNTSVSFRLHGSPASQVLDLFGLGTRIPSEVYCPSTSRESWVFGGKAWDSYQASRMTDSEGVFARDLKSALRSSPDALLPGSESITFKQVVSEFFSRLLREAILPHAVKHAPDALSNQGLEFRFMLPVLDQGDLLDRYRETLLGLAEEAGFRGYGQLEWSFEPVAAASYIIREQKHGVKPGGKLVVFDSGAGTTDICVGTVSVQNGLVHLEDIETYDAPYNEARKFGGATVTWALGMIWANKHALHLRELVEKYELQDASIQDEHFLEASSPDRSLEKTDERMNPLWPWQDKYPALWREVNRLKEHATASVQYLWNSPKLPAGAPSKITLQSKMLAGLSAEFCGKFRSVLNTIASKDPLAHWFMVGGNMRTPGLASEVGSGRLYTVSAPEHIDVTVAKGGSWIGEWVAGGLPYSLTVRAHGDMRTLPIGMTATPGHSESVGTQFQVDTGMSIAVSLEGESVGRHHELGAWDVRLPVSDSASLVKMSVSLDYPKVVLRLRDSSGADLWKVDYVV